MAYKELDENRLRKNLTLFNAITLILGSVVGSGIFVSSSGILKQSGSSGLSVLVWINCGILSLLGSLCYAELGTMITESGGDYIYIMRAFGSFPAFVRMWVEVVVIKPSLIAICAIVFAKYFLKDIYSACSPLKPAVLLLSNLCILIVTAINCVSVKVSSFIQDVLSLIKISALLSVIFTGIYYLTTGHIDTLNIDFKGTTKNFNLIALSHYQGLLAYSGWLTTVVTP